MAYETVSFSSFGGGLNLADKEDQVNESEAIDLMNVVFTERGAVKQRSGYDNLTSSALTNRVASLHPYYTTGGTKQLLAGCGTRLEALSTAGAVVASQASLTDGTWDFCRFGSPGSEVAYAGQGKNLLYKWNGTAWASVANSPKARYLAVMAVDQGNRMVAGGFDDSATAGPTASQAYTSRVWFSGAGAPETWSATDYVDLTPGDGELIQSVIAWREFVFVFKETKYFVFYGSSEDSGGNAVFNYTTVDTGVGLASPRAIAAARNAVYFMSRDGVYRTTGGDPERVSDAIEPIWSGEASAFYTGGTLAHASITNCAMEVHQERVYLAYPTASANDRILVFDPEYDWWSLWNIPASSLASFRISNQAELVFGYPAGSNDVGRHSMTYTSDDAAAISSFWRSGWADYGVTDTKTIRESKAWGSGVVACAVSHDFFQSPGSLVSFDFSDPTALTWGGTTWGGTTWAAARGRVAGLRRRAVRGTVFSTYFSNSTLDQDWTVARLDHHLREARIPSITTAVAS